MDWPVLELVLISICSSPSASFGGALKDRRPLTFSGSAQVGPCGTVSCGLHFLVDVDLCWTSGASVSACADLSLDSRRSFSRGVDDLDCRLNSFGIVTLGDFWPMLKFGSASRFFRQFFSFFFFSFASSRFLSSISCSRNSSVLKIRRL
jgi:hypothetical protein